MMRMMLVMVMGVVGFAWGAATDDAVKVKVEEASVSTVLVHSIVGGGKMDPPLYTADLKLLLESPALKGTIGVGSLTVEKAELDAGWKLEGKEVSLASTLKRPTHDGVQLVNDMVLGKASASDGAVPVVVSMATGSKVAGKITQFKGTVTALVAGKVETVSVEKPGEMEGKEISDKILAAAGVKVTVQKANIAGIALEMTGKSWVVTGARIKSATSKPEVQYFVAEVEGKTFLALMTELPDDAVLELYVATSIKEMKVPIEVKDRELRQPG